MQGSLDLPPVVVRGSLVRALGLFVGSAVFVAGGLAILVHGGSPVIGALTLGFFGLCGALALAMLISPPRLEIGPQGVVHSALWRSKAYAWTDVYNFQPVTLGISTRMVGFDYVNPAPDKPKLARYKATLGVHGAIAAGLELPPDKLADLLNQARERWLGQPDAALQAAASQGASIVSRRERPSPVTALMTGARLDRKTYWMAVGVLVALSVALSFVPGSRTGISGVSTVLLIRIYAGRLHDLGRSAWWQLVLYALMIGVLVWALAARQPAALGIGAAFLIQLAFIVVLGVIPGTRGANRFGPSPGQPTPMQLAETFR
jgi:uncharacterized membrane protein YhaH (DUF805 family)